MTPASSRTLKIVGASLVLLALVWQHIEATRLGYRVEKQRHEAQLLRARIAAIDIELETSVSPAQLASRARSRLGMYPAPPESLRILADGPDARREGFLTRLFPKARRGLVAAANG